MNLDFSEVSNNLRLLDNRAKINAEKVMDFTMAEAENYAKQSAPWKDRTGNARRSIAHLTKKINNVIIGVLGIGVYYGKYLELSNQGKYRIIRPTIDIYRNKLMQNLRTLL